jgi:GNAT superfamily N-acetyltransferase
MWDAALTTLREAGWQVEMTCHAAPVQLEGVLPCGERFYFRSRHDEVLLAVGGVDPADAAPWERQVDSAPHDASFLPAEPGLRLLLDLAAEHRRGCPTPWWLRRATPADGDFLADMLVAVVNWSTEWKPRSRRRVLSTRSTARYVAQPADVAIVAEVGAELVGAVWLRFFPESEPGYGFVAAGVPELMIGVAAPWRGRGVGRALLRAVEPPALAAGIRQISLSVERKNLARRLYLAEGYRVVRAGYTGSDVMIKRLG